MTTECTIEERGNGFPDVGDYCAGDDGQLYRIVGLGRIQIDPRAGAPNWCPGTVELVDWTECAEEDEHTAAVVLKTR